MSSADLSIRPIPVQHGSREFLAALLGDLVPFVEYGEEFLAEIPKGGVDGRARIADLENWLRYLDRRFFRASVGQSEETERPVEQPSDFRAGPSLAVVLRYLDSLAYVENLEGLCRLIGEWREAMTAAAQAQLESERGMKDDRVVDAVEEYERRQHEILERLDSYLEAFRVLRNQIVHVRAHSEEATTEPTAGDEVERPVQGDDLGVSPHEPASSAEGSPSHRERWYHHFTEDPPQEFPYGPLPGQKQQLAHALFGREVDPRRIRAAANEGLIWVRKRHRCRYEMFFRTEGEFRQAKTCLPSLRNTESQPPDE